MTHTLFVKYDVVEKLAAALDTTAEYLLGQGSMLVLAAQEQGGYKAAKDLVGKEAAGA